MDLEARLIQRVVREREKLEADLRQMEPTARLRILSRYTEESTKLADRLKDAK